MHTYFKTYIEVYHNQLNFSCIFQIFKFIIYYLSDYIYQVL